MIEIIDQIMGDSCVITHIYGVNRDMQRLEWSGMKQGRGRQNDKTKLAKR